MPRLKAVLSCCMGLALLITMLSGLSLWIWPGGMVLGIARWILTDIHAWSSIVFFAMCLIHFLLNLKLLRGEFSAFKKKSRSSKQ